MKLLLVTLSLGAVGVVHSHAQGMLSWGNVFGNTITGVRAPIYGRAPTEPFRQLTGNSPTGVPAGTTHYGSAPLLEGTGFTAALFAGLSPSAVQAQQTAADSTVFRTGAAAGFIVGPRTVTIQGILPGNPAFLQIRAWANRGGTVTSWAAVMADPTVAHGASDVFQTGILGGIDTAGNPVPPPQSLGIRSFNILGGGVVPEPSLLALSALALGALLLRRKQSRWKERTSNDADGH